MKYVFWAKDTSEKLRSRENVGNLFLIRVWLPCWPPRPFAVLVLFGVNEPLVETDMMEKSFSRGI